MDKQYSIAEAKNCFAHLVHEVEAGGPVEVTRRGKSVAVVMSSEEYRRLCKQDSRGGDLWTAIVEWRKETGGVELSNEEIDSWRDKSLPREYDWS